MYKQAIVNNLIKIATKTVVPEGFFNIADVNMPNPFTSDGIIFNQPYAEAFERQREQLKFQMSLDKRYGLTTKLPTMEGPAGYFNITDINAANPFDKLYQAAQYEKFEDQRSFLRAKAKLAKESEPVNAAINQVREQARAISEKYSKTPVASQPAPTTNVPTTTATAPKSNVPAPGTGGKAGGGAGKTMTNAAMHNKWLLPAALVATPVAIAGGAYLWNRYRNRNTYGAPTPGVGAFGQMALDRFGQ